MPTIQFGSTVFTKVYSPDRFAPNSLVLSPQLQGRDEFPFCDKMFGMPTCQAPGLQGREALGTLRGLSVGCLCRWVASPEGGVVGMHLERPPGGPGLGDFPWGPCQNPQGRPLLQEFGMLCLPPLFSYKRCYAGRSQGGEEGERC